MAVKVEVVREVVAKAAGAREVGVKEEVSRVVER